MVVVTRLGVLRVMLWGREVVPRWLVMTALVVVVVVAAACISIIEVRDGKEWQRCLP